MKRAAWLLAFMVAGATMLGAATYFPSLTAALLTVTRAAPETWGEPPGPIGAVDVTVTVPKQSTGYEWPGWFKLFSHADKGQSAAVTGQAFCDGEATCWGGVHEAHGLQPRTNIVGSEVDAVASGMMTDEKHDYRVGLQIVLGKSRLSTTPGPAEIGSGIDIVPQNGVQGDLRMRTGINIMATCVDTCIRLSNGGSITWDGNGGDVVEKFDFMTGYKGLWNHSRELFSVNLSHGGLHVVTVPCPASVPAPVARLPPECIRVNETGYLPVYR